MDMPRKAQDRTVIEFDHSSSEHAKSWPEAYERLREGCPRGWTESHGGYWVATRYKDVMSVAQDPACSTEKVYNPETGELHGGNIIPPFPVQPVIPIECENEAWRGYRSFLNRKFSPAMAESRRPVAQAIARTLIDKVIESGRIDFVEDLTSPLPAITTLEMFGFDLDDWIEFAEPIHKYMYYRPDHPEYSDIANRLALIIERLHREAADRRKTPRDDLMSYIANGEVGGKLLSETEVSQMSLNIIFGGVDTTTALTSNVLRHFGQHPEERQRLIEDPKLRSIAREECIRFYAPVHGVARHATKDLDINGWKIGEGESIFLAIASANRDPEVFEDADQFLIDRHPNRHIGFGAGRHHCLGLFIARAMYDAMMDEVLDRLPDYTLIAEEEEPYTSVDKVNGWAHLPATFTPGSVLGGGLKL